MQNINLTFKRYKNSLLTVINSMVLMSSTVRSSELIVPNTFVDTSQ